MTAPDSYWSRTLPTTLPFTGLGGWPHVSSSVGGTEKMYNLCGISQTSFNLNILFMRMLIWLAHCEPFNSNYTNEFKYVVEYLLFYCINALYRAFMWPIHRGNKLSRNEREHGVFAFSMWALYFITRSKVSEGYVFTDICLSKRGGVGAVLGGDCPAPPRTRPPPSRTRPPPPRIGPTP